MNRDQAARLLDLGFTCVARYDVAGQRTSSWAPDPASCWSHLVAADTAVARARQRASWAAQWPVAEQSSRDVAVDALSGLLTILVPMPAGGFVVAVVERWLLRKTAEALADELEAAVQREFGSHWAPYVAAAIALAAFVVVIAIAGRAE